MSRLPPVCAQLRAPTGSARHRSPRIVRGDALTAAPWKNGGGVTREIAAYPVGAGLDTFVWRVSVADVEQPGPFSRFQGVERTLVLLDGAGMRLLERADDQAGGDGGDSRVAMHALTRPLDAARFDGAAAVDAELVDGATRDFNLMVRRAHASAALEVWKGASGSAHMLDADAALLFCARGALDVRFAGEPHPYATLAAMDTLVLDAPRRLACEVAGEGVVLAVLIRYA